MIRGEVISQIHWGKEVPEVLAHLKTQYGIEGDDADTMISEALGARQREIRKKALLRLIFAGVGLVVTAAYFTMNSIRGSISISAGSALFTFLGTISLWTAVRSIGRLFSGESSGPA